LLPGTGAAAGGGGGKGRLCGPSELPVDGELAAALAPLAGAAGALAGGAGAGASGAVALEAGGLAAADTVAQRPASNAETSTGATFRWLETRSVPILRARRSMKKRPNLSASARRLPIR